MVLTTRLERWLAVWATAALTLAIFLMPAKAESAACSNGAHAALRDAPATTRAFHAAILAGPGKNAADAAFQ